MVRVNKKATIEKPITCKRNEKEEEVSFSDSESECEVTKKRHAKTFA